MNRFLPVVVALLALSLAMAGCSSPEKSAKARSSAPPSWQLTLGADHSLAGRIWQASKGRFVSPEDVQQALGKADFILLGEKHDNADHHRLQAWLLAGRLGRGPALPVAFEMITTDKAVRLGDYQRDHRGDAAGLGDYLQWQKSGWPDWQIYQPVFQAAMAANAPLIAASQPRKSYRRMFKQSIRQVLGDDAYERLGLPHKFPPAIKADQAREIRDSHCNMLPESMVAPMVAVQGVKDAYMADILISADDKYGGGAVLIAGNGHARGDYGVPWHLARTAPGKTIVTVGLIEVAQGAGEPQAYADRFGGRLPFDFIWFTPRVDDEDPCARFETQLKKIGRGAGQK